MKGVLIPAHECSISDTIRVLGDRFFTMNETDYARIGYELSEQDATDLERVAKMIRESINTYRASKATPK